MDRFDDLDPQLKKKLEKLQEVPPRTERDILRGKALFLNKAVNIASQPVTGLQKWRRKKWLGKKPDPALTRKERFPVMGTVTAIVLALALLFGGTGGTVYASQSSIPGEALYPVKTLSEDVRNMITIDPQASIDLNLDLADRRVAEIASLEEEGLPLEESVVVRLENHLNTALQQAANLEGDEFDEAVEQVKSRLEVQEKNMQQVNMNEDPKGEALRIMSSNMIQERIRLLEEGEESPVMLKQQLQGQQQLNQDETGAGQGAGSQNGQGQSEDGEDTTGQGSGNGQGAGADVESQDSTGEGSQNGQRGQNETSPGQGGQPGQGQGGQNSSETCLDTQCTVTPMPQGAGQGKGNGKGK